MCSKGRAARLLPSAPTLEHYRVLFTRTTDLVQQLQMSRQELRLAATIEKLDKYHLLVLTISPMSKRVRPRQACSSS